MGKRKDCNRRRRPEGERSPIMMGVKRGERARQTRGFGVVERIGPVEGGGGSRADQAWHEAKKKEAAGEEPVRIVVYVVDGTVRHVVATKQVEIYVVEHDLRHDHGKHGINTEICGIPVMLSRRENVVAPQLVRRVVKAHRKTRG
jgi:hypothetical protein